MGNFFRRIHYWPRRSRMDADLAEEMEFPPCSASKILAHHAAGCRRGSRHRSAGAPGGPRRSADRPAMGIGLADEPKLWPAASRLE